MQQPWDEPAESIEQAAESLPLAGLLAELLAGAEAEGAPQAGPAAAGEEGAAPAAGGPWFVAPAPAQMEVADLMRALGEVQQERQEEAAGDLSGHLLARLMDDPAGQAADAGAAVPPVEPPPVAPPAPEEPGREFCAPPEATQSEPAPAVGASTYAEAAEECGPAPECLTAAVEEPSDHGVPVAGAPMSDAGAAPAEPISAAAPAADPASAAALSMEPAAEELTSADSLAAEPSAGAGASCPDAAAAASATSWPDICAEVASGAALQTRVEPVEPASSAAQTGSAIVQKASPVPALPPEEDEFELVDAETAGRMLDQLIDAARSAIQSSLAAPPQAQSSAIEAWPAAPDAAPPSGASAAMESPGSGGALRAGRAEEAVQPLRPATGRPSYSAEELGQEPPPLPPAAALIGMGLPERLRARLELIGDLEKVLAAQSDEAAARAVDRRSRLLVFRVGDGYYGLPIEHVREVERVTRVTPVPGAPRFVRGLVNLRGEILPLVDMRLLLGAGAEDLPASPRLVVAQADRKEPPLALMVEELNGLAPVEEGASGPAAGEASPLPWARGSVEHRGRRVWRLDPAAMLSLAALEERAELR